MIKASGWKTDSSDQEVEILRKAVGIDMIQQGSYVSNNSAGGIRDIMAVWREHKCLQMLVAKATEAGETLRSREVIAVVTVTVSSKGN